MIIFVLAVWYQALLLKAVLRQCIILFKLRFPDQSLLQQKQRRRSSSCSSVPSNPDNLPLLQPLQQQQEEHENTETEAEDRQPSDETSEEDRGISLRWPSFDELDEDLLLLTNAMESLTWSDSFRILNLWFVIATLGNVFGFIYSIK